MLLTRAMKEKGHEFEREQEGYYDIAFRGPPPQEVKGKSLLLKTPCISDTGPRTP